MRRILWLAVGLTLVVACRRTQTAVPSPPPLMHPPESTPSGTPVIGAGAGTSVDDPAPPPTWPDMSEPPRWSGMPLSEVKSASSGAEVEAAWRQYGKLAVDWYRRHGSRNAKWDKLVEELLANEPAAVIAVDSAAWGPRAPQVYQALDEARCDDPLALSHLAPWSDAGWNRDYRPVVWKAIEQTGKLGVPAELRPFESPLEICFIDTGRESADQAKLAKAGELAARWFAEAAAKPVAIDGWQRLVWQRFAILGQQHTPELSKEMLAALGEHKADPWLVEMFAGFTAYNAALMSRGTDVAANVSDEQWAGAASHGTQAYEHLCRAYELHPEWPEPCVYLISLAMEGSVEMPETPRDWFDRGVAAQFDWMQLYAQYILALLPRWGGSHAEMLAFGRECAATARHDTPVPYILVEVLAQAAYRDRLELWAMPGLYDEIKAVIDQRIAVRPSLTPGLRSALAAIAWRAGRPDEAAALVKELGDKFRSEHVDSAVSFSLGRFYTEVILDRAPHQATWRAAEQAAGEADYAAAAEAYSKLLAADLPPGAKAMVKQRHDFMAERATESRRTLDQYEADQSVAAESPPLIAAVLSWDMIKLRELLAAGTDVNQRDAEGKTALYWAVAKDLDGPINQLLDAGADPNLADADGLTPLHLCAREGKQTVVMRLLQGGADPKLKDKAGKTAADLAAAAGHDGVAQVIRGAQ